MENEIRKAYEENDYIKVYDLYTQIYEKTKSIDILYKKSYFSCFILCEHFDEILKDLDILSKHRTTKETKKYITLMYARCYYIQDDYIKASIYLDECEKYDFNIEEYSYIIGLKASTNQMIFDQTNKEEYGIIALKYYKLAIEADESNKINCLKGIVDVEFNLKHYDEAYDALLELMKLGVKDSTMYYYMAHIKMNKNEYKDALYYLELCKQYNDSQELDTNFAACYFQLGEKERAIKILKDLIQNKNDIDYYYQLAYFYFDGKMYKYLKEDPIFDQVLLENEDFKFEFASKLLTCFDFEVSLKGFDYMKELFILKPQNYYYSFFCASKAFHKQKESISVVNELISKCEDEEVLSALNYTLFLIYRSFCNKEKTLEYLEKTPKDYDYYSHLSNNSDMMFDNEKQFKKFISNSLLSKVPSFRLVSSLYGYKYLKCKKPKQVFKKIVLNPKNLCVQSLITRYFEFTNESDKSVINAARIYNEQVIEDDYQRLMTDCNCYVSFYALYLLKGMINNDKKKQYDLSKEIILYEIKKFKLCQHQNITYLYSYFALKQEKNFEYKYALLLLDGVEGENELDIELYYLKYNLYERIGCKELSEEYKNKFEKMKKYAPLKVVEYYEEHEGEEVIIPLLNNN